MKILSFLVIILILILFIGSYAFIRGKKANTSDSENIQNTRICRLAISKSYFPQSVLDYKIVESSDDKKDQASASYTGANNEKAYFGIRTIELSRKSISSTDLPPDSKYKSLIKDPNFLELIFKEIKGEATQKELDKIAELTDFNGSIKYENVDGLKVLTGEKYGYTPGYMPGFSYYDPQSQLILHVSFSDSNKNDSILYFKDWAKQMCAN